MSDITLLTVTDDGPGVAAGSVIADIALDGTGDLLSGSDLATAVKIALLTDRFAEADELSPEHEGDRAGWWADMQAEEIRDGWPVGSKLWLLKREKLTSETVERANHYAREALQPFIDRGIASAVSVNLVRDGLTAITGPITLFSNALQPVAQRFELHWTGFNT